MPIKKTAWNADCSIERIGSGNDVRLARVAELYVDAFPESERKPVGFLTRALERDDYRLFGLICGGKLDGFALVYERAEGEFRLLEYMTIAAEKRNRGYGALLFRAIAAQGPKRPLLLEVEREPDTGREVATVRRRKDFYLRLGCRPIPGLDYAMPRIASAAPPPMMLFELGAGRIGEAALRRWLSEIYNKVYGVGLAEDRLNAMLGKEEAPR